MTIGIFSPIIGMIRGRDVSLFRKGRNVGLAHEIVHVEKGSIAERLGLREGDALAKINGEALIDQIDYQALTAQSPCVLEVIRRDGRVVRHTVHKEDDEPLGITLSDTMLCNPRVCKNHCIFCFIDQMRPGLRKSLYVKDDDWRLSLMMGNFVTLTNVDDQELDRIIRRHASPLYISVHATDGQVRRRMMRNPNAEQILPRLKRLRDNGIRFHCQIVCCPGWNDGEVLRQTLDDLAALAPAAQTVAVVPVGLTGYREGLEPLTLFNRETAGALLDQLEPMRERFLRELGTRFVFPSDEFYCLSGRPLPPDEAYEGYPQIENGVGILRQFETDARWAREDLEGMTAPAKRYAIPVGMSARAFFWDFCREFAPAGVTLTPQAIENRFFGPTITVTGLLTGGDILAQLDCASCDEVLLFRNTLRAEGDLFLDDMSLEEFRARLPIPVRVVSTNGEQFYRALYGLEEA